MNFKTLNINTFSMKNYTALLPMFLIVFLSLTTVTAQEDAKTLFRHNCMACHSIDQNLVGPALKGVTERRDSAWLYSFIKGSQAMVQAGDPLAVELFNKFNKIPMPDQNLSNEQIKIILDYIEGEAQQAAEAAANANPIQRPEEFYGANYRQLSFGDFIFWIPVTITIIILIVTLVAFTYANDTLKEARKETIVPQEEL